VISGFTVIFPVDAPDVKPLSGQLLKGVGGGSDRGGFACLLRDDGVLASGGVGLQFGSLLASQIIADIWVATQAQP
jgi:hypothetical protein